ncbi:MAG: T9SS type A sorting domain-containing protein [Flavobacteriales bacterium]|nr:T9SS type A sorting domain-containing protein [Flavobacteriales bacterium]
MKKIFTFLALSILTISLIAQPANDNCASATVITWNGAAKCSNTTSATTQAGETLTCIPGATQTAWFSFVASNDTAVIKTTNFTSGGCVMRYSIFGPNPTCQPTGGACSGNVTNSELTWTGLTVGATYLIQVSYLSGGACGGSATNFCFAVYDPLPPAPNYGSTCALASQMYVSATCWDVPSGNTSAVTCNWTPASIDQSCTAANDAVQCGYWAKFTANSTSTTIDMVDFNGAQTANYFDISIYTGTCGSFTQVDCRSVDSKNNAYSITTTAGTEYYMLITTGSAYSGTTMNVSICGGACTVPPNNNCASAIPVSSGVLYTGNTSCATPDAALCSGSTENNVWYSWTAPATWPAGDPAFIIMFNQDCYLDNALTYSSGTQFSLYNSSEVCGTITGGVGECMVYHNPGNAANTYATFVPVAGQTYLLNFDGFGGDACTFSFQLNNAPVLPIKLLDFSAEYLDKKVQLDWITETEINNDFFTVERSIDGVIFETVSIIKGAGNSNNRLTYSSKDLKPKKGTSYYRLKQTDYDGKYSYSSIESVIIKDRFEGFSVFPNPVTGNGYLAFNSSVEDTKTIVIYDISGRLVYEQLFNIQKGNNKLTLETQNLTQGMYFIKMINEDGVNLKFIKD